MQGCAGRKRAWNERLWTSASTKCGGARRNRRRIERPNVHLLKPILEAQRAQVDPSARGIGFAGDIRHAIDADKGLERAAGNELIAPARGVVPKGDEERVGGKRSLGAETHGVGKYAAEREAEQFLIGAPGQGGQTQEKREDAEVEERMATFERKAGDARVESLEELGPSD